ncbi:MAG: stage III sporulation protein AB [Firmicutes bacterium]|nr:stage III sporulation protein AB [Bacillota bacterium]
MSIITRFLIVASLSAAGAMGGLYFSKRLKTRASYYEALVDFINHTLTQVKFRKDPIKKIMQSFIDLGETPLNKNLLEYIAVDTPNSLSLSRGVLKTGEIEEIKQFLVSIGTLDSQTQIFELEAYKEKFNHILVVANEKKRIFGGMYVKLGFFAGLALGIIVI